MSTLKGKRIYLRPVSADDAALMVEWRNQPEILATVFDPRPVSPEGHRAWLAGLAGNPARLEFIITLTESGRAIGRIGLDHIDHLHQRAEYSISIGDLAQWGKGYGREATDLILTFGFQELNLHKIYLKVFEENVQAVQMYEKVGFAIEGRLVDEVFKDGGFQTVLLMSIFREEYLGK